MVGKESQSLLTVSFYSSEFLTQASRVSVYSYFTLESGRYSDDDDVVPFCSNPVSRARFRFKERFRCFQLSCGFPQSTSARNLRNVLSSLDNKQKMDTNKFIEEYKKDFLDFKLNVPKP